MHAKKSIKRKSFALIRVIRGQTLFLSYSKVPRVVPRHAVALRRRLNALVPQLGDGSAA